MAPLIQKSRSATTLPSSNQRDPGVRAASAQRKLAEQALQRTLDELRQQVASYRSVFEAGSEGYIIHDDGIIIEVNHQFEELTGYRGSELVGQSFLKLINYAGSPGAAEPENYVACARIDESRRRECPSMSDLGSNWMCHEGS